MNKIVLSEKDLETRIGKQCEQEFVRLLSGTFNNITEKYEDMIKEQTQNEIDKANEYVETQCPNHGVIVFKIDNSDVQVPVKKGSIVKLSDGAGSSMEIKCEEHLTSEDLSDIFKFVSKSKSKLLYVTTIMTRDVEWYDKKEDETFEKITRDYITEYNAVIDTDKITSIYTINAELK